MPQQNSNRAISILLITNWLVMLAAAMFGPIYAFFVQHVGGGILAAGYSSGVYHLAGALMMLFSGRWSDHHKRNELLIVLGYSIMGMAFISYLFVGNVVQLLTVQAIIGIGAGLYIPVFDELYSLHTDKKHAGAEWGNRAALNWFTSAASTTVGAVLATRFGFNVMFVGMGILCFASALYILLLPRDVL